MPDDPSPNGRHSAAVPSLSLWQSTLNAIASLGWIGLIISVVCVGASIYLVVPPFLLKSDVVEPTPSRLAVVLDLGDESSTEPLTYISSHYELFGGELGDITGTEQILAAVGTRTDHSEVLGATILASGPAAKDWHCGLEYWESKTRLDMTIVDPNSTSFPADKVVVAPALGLSNTTWTRAYLAAPVPGTNTTSLGSARGVACTREVNRVDSDDAGDRWFSVTGALLATEHANADGTVQNNFDGGPTTYSQDVNISVPRTYEEVSGLKERDGDASSNLVADQIAAYGSIELPLPVELAPPGTTAPTYVYRDQDVVAANNLRVGFGWAIFGAWAAIVIPIVITRATRTRR